MNDRPVVAFILSLIGSFLILLGGVYALFYLSTVFYGPGPIVAIISIASGILVLAGAVMLYVSPPQHVAWGIVVLLFSIVSFFPPFYGFNGGFVVGMVLGIVGGSLGIAWKPGPASGFAAMRTCLTCGRHVLAEYPICPYCGAAAPAWKPPAPPPPSTFP